ncbi:fimbria/pilus periplasmic chaperone [Providencia rettgeri]|nr:fimbria/pilus periplasmic chaperone [Providencia rettgeri]
MVSIQMANYSEQPTLTQMWIYEGNINWTPETTNAPFIVTPRINKIAANEGVQLRIRFLGKNLPMDRESVYYLNVLDIVPKSKNTQGMNTLQLAIKTRIKVFYRPISLLPFQIHYCIALSFIPITGY